MGSMAKSGQIFPHRPSKSKSGVAIKIKLVLLAQGQFEYGA
jgi:hypothetical protein